MKAWVLRGIGDLRFEDAEKPVPKSNEVLVHVKYAGICSSDLPRVFATGAYHYPIVLGHEFSGIAGDGRRVGVFPLLPCFACESCKAGRYETCADYGYIGSRQNGAFAEYVAVPEWNLIELPGNVSFEEAALLEPAAVALHAAGSIDFEKAKSAVVVGNGAIGRLIAKWLEIKGVNDVVLCGKTGVPVKADVYFEAVGNTESFGTCVENVNPNGRVVLVGNPDAGFEIGQTLYRQILRKQLTVRGSWNSSYPRDWRKVLEHIKALGLPGLISHRVAFDRLDSALDMMVNKREPRCKVLLHVSD